MIIFRIKKLCVTIASTKQVLAKAVLSVGFDIELGVPDFHTRYHEGGGKELAYVTASNS